MLYSRVSESASYLRDSLPQVPHVGLILGSGLGPIADSIEDPHCIPYASVPYMVQSSAPGHNGCFVCGMLNGVYVICMQGRLHAYEGHAARDIAYPVFVLKELGVETLLITNASGGINTEFAVGDLMLINDHINFTGKNPLIGPEEPGIGPRFNDMTNAYSPILARKIKAIAKRQQMDLKEGVYLGCLGPSFETPAEIRAFRTWGADAVGMSTVFEVIAAANCGMEVAAIALITNAAAGMSEMPITSEEVNEVANRKAVGLCALFCELLQEL